MHLVLHLHKQKVDLSSVAVLEVYCTRALLRHAYVAQEYFCFGKALSGSTVGLPTPLVWHLCLMVQETKWEESGEP